MSVVAASDQPLNDGVSSAASIVAEALRDLGVNPVANEVSSPGFTAEIISQADLAAQALRAVGVNPVAESDVQDTLTVTHSLAQIAALALVNLGVNQGGTGTPSSTVFSTTDVGTRALVMLNIYSTLDTPGSTDLTMATSYAASFHDAMVTAGYATWTASAIPQAVMNLYVIAVAAEIAPQFEKPADPQGYAGAVSAIKGLALAGLDAQAYALDVTTQVHQMILGKNLATWGLNTIPDAVVPYYWTLAVQEMAAAFGRPFDPAAYNGAMAGLRRFALSGSYGQTLALAKVVQFHERVNALNYCSWTVAAVPAAAAEAYVQAAAFLLEPSLQKAPDQPQLFSQQAFDAALDRVRSIVLSGAYAVAIANAELSNVHYTLLGAGFVSWDLSTIPSSAADSYVSLLSANLAPTFGKEMDYKAIQLAETQVKNFAMQFAAQPLAEQVLRGLHAEWRVRGMTRWEVMDIPREAEEAYVCATAARCAPQFPGTAYDQNAEQMAERQLWQAIAVATAGRPIRAVYL